MDSFELELKQGFLEEAAQLISEVETCFLALENDGDKLPLLENIFRMAHNLKGSAKAVGFVALGDFTHEFESFMIKVKQNKIPLITSTISLLLKCNDHLFASVEMLKKDFDAASDHGALVAEMRNVESGANLNMPEVASPDHGLSPDNNSLETPSFEEVQALLSQVDNLNSVEEIIIPELPQVSKAPTTAPADESIRVNLNKLDKLINFVGEMVILQTILKEQIGQTSSMMTRKTVHHLGKVSKEIQDISMGLRMVPLKKTFQKMQRVARDTAEALGKKVEIRFEGEEIEVDKTILERLSDPLVHMIRNAVDHGIESLDKRLANGKNEVGHILLSAANQSGSLVLHIVDDGGGIDSARLKEKAIEKNIIRSNSALSEKDLLNLIFHPGFSTKGQVTDISGRGVGMDVVKNNIEQLKGEIDIKTEVGKGTHFKIKLPLTLAIIDAMIIQDHKERFVIPLNHVHESLRPRPAEVSFVTGMGEVLLLRGENLPLYRLSTLLGLKERERSLNDCTVIVNRTLLVPYAVVVDEILGQYQVVTKSLGPELAHIRVFSGCAILGDGKPSLIVELNELVQKMLTKNQNSNLSSTISRGGS